MMQETVPTADMQLIELARDTIRRRYMPKWHVIGAALRTRHGRIFTGVHLEAHVGRIAVCAEEVALGQAATFVGDTDIDTIVAVCHPCRARRDTTIKIIAPCGMCREMISDYSPRAMVILPVAGGGFTKKSVQYLLPDKYSA